MTVVGAIGPGSDPNLGMVGSHPLMVALREDIRRAAPLDAPVVVWGPTGVGKELVARALHAVACPPGAPFIPLNVAALAGSVVEAELFGSVRGGYTGATNRSGLIEGAQGGLLFLDEAADLPRPVQAKLLRVLDDGVVRRVGSVSTLAVRFRLVVAVQRAPEKLVSLGRWRDDFYYRVAGILLRVPTLEERRSDIAALAWHCVERRRLPPLDDEAVALLEWHPWPGNVRDLDRALVRAAHRAANGRLTAAEVRAALDVGAELARGAGTAAPAWLAGVAAADREVRAASAADPLLLQTCEAQGWNGAAIARALGVSRTTVYLRLRAAGLSLRARKKMFRNVRNIVEQF